MAEESKTTFENDRQYANSGKYFMPMDAPEVKRLDTQHQIWLDTLDNKLFLSPISLANRSILEVGAGSGIWALQCAQENPTSKITGIDLAKIQPTDLPPNLSFQMADAEKSWDFATEPFDFIHSRLLVNGMHAWSEFFKRGIQHLNPGGWMEVQEVAYPMQVTEPGVSIEDSPILKWSNLHKDAAAKTGIDCGAAATFKHLMVEAGFVNVEETAIQWPLGPWGKDEKEKKIGELSKFNMDKGISAFSLAFLTKFGGMNRDQAEGLFQDVREEMDNTDKHFYTQIIVLRGQKPTGKTSG